MSISQKFKRGCLHIAADGHVYSRKCQRRQLYVSFRDLDWQVRRCERAVCYANVFSLFFYILVVQLLTP